MVSYVLSDSNILLRQAKPDHPQHQETEQALEVLRLRGDTLCVVPQNLVEFRAVATRPLSVNGLGMTQAEVKAELARIRQLFVLLEETPTIFAEWERLVDTYTSEGKQNHDARIVAAMNVHSITAILTFNADDFLRYPGLDGLQTQRPCTIRRG